MMAQRITRWLSRIKNFRFIRSEQPEETNRHIEPQEENFTRVLVRFEPFVIKLQKILIWENAVVSLLSVLAVNLLFWLAINFECRFYGIFFSVLLIGFLYDQWMERIWPEISVASLERRTTEESTSIYPRVLTVPEISHYLTHAYGKLKDHYNWLKALREEQPGLFCSSLCFCFAVLSIIGRTVPGLVISYCLIMLVMVGPGICIHFLCPPAVLERMWIFQRALQPKEKDTDSEVEDYMPEQSGENLALLQLAGDANEEEQHDESLLIAEEFGLDVDPADMNTLLAHDEGSTDGMDISEFDLSAPPSLSNHGSSYQQSSLPEAEGLDTDDSEEKDVFIKFRNLHFNNDSSEEEELAFAQGLGFADNSIASERAPLSEGTPSIAGFGDILSSTALQAVTQKIADISAMGQSIVTTVMSGGPSKSEPTLPRKKPHREDSSSGESEEFEMISRDDLSQ